MNQKFLAVLTVLLMSALCANAADVKVDGYPIANFAVTANIHQTGGFYGDIMRNPGKLGTWLESCGGVVFYIAQDGNRHSFDSFRNKRIERAFPFASGVYEGSPLTDARISMTTYCPLGVNDIEISSLPVILLEMSVDNMDRSHEEFEVVIDPGSLFKDGAEWYRDGDIWGIKAAYTQISADIECRWEEGILSIPLSLKGCSSANIRIAIILADEEGYSACEFSSSDEISRYVFSNWKKLKTRTTAFSDAIPATGDKELDNYLRWYMTPAICLTKCTKNGEILTMGYIELNQRDSYWTSWLHLVMFRDAERKMIEESIAYQQESGKIPTTILPLIEREDDLDINAFFILRVARYYKLYRDSGCLARYWPSLCKAMEWLISRDSDGDGIPCQHSFWGDWKDVQGVTDRKYSPFSGLIYLAALKEMVYMAETLDDDAAAEGFRRAYDKGFEFMNRPIENGGMWNGRYYCQIWKDGSVNDRLLQDQTIGILFGVIPEERAQQIFDSLNEMSLTRYGVAETYPYYPAEWGYEPATYHNGAVWPWVSFMDCWARLNSGRRQEAIDIEKRVAKADLVDSGDWTPNEHINSLTGENLGFKIQGWNAALFGMVKFGLMNPESNLDIP